MSRSTWSRTRPFALLIAVAVLAWVVILALPGTGANTTGATGTDTPAITAAPPAKPDTTTSDSGKPDSAPVESTTAPVTQPHAELVTADTGPLTVVVTVKPAAKPARAKPAPAPDTMPGECATLATLPAYTYAYQGAEVSVPDGATRLDEMRADGMSGAALAAACAVEVADQHARTAPPVEEPVEEPVEDDPAPHVCPDDTPVWTGVACVPGPWNPCPSGQVPDDSGACVVPTCPAGTTAVEDGTCAPDTYWQDPPVVTARQEVTTGG